MWLTCNWNAELNDEMEDRMNEKHKLVQSHAYDVVLRRFDCIRNQLMNEQAVVFRFHMRTRCPRWRKVLQKKSSFRFRISFWNQIELFQTTTKKSLKQKNYKWNSKLITKWRQLVYFGLVNGARIVVVVRRCLCCVSHLIYFIFFSSWLAGNESCLPFCWHYYSMSYTG